MTALLSEIIVRIDLYRLSSCNVNVLNGRNPSFFPQFSFVF